MKTLKSKLFFVISIALILLIALFLTIYNHSRISSSQNVVNILKDVEKKRNHAKYQKQINPDSSILIYNNLVKELFPFQKNDTILHTIAIVYAELGNIYILKGDYETAQSLLKKSRDIRLGKNDYEVDAIVLINEGVINYHY